MGRDTPEPPQRGSCARRGPRGPGWGRHRRRFLGSCAGLGRDAGQGFPEAPGPGEVRRGGWRVEASPGCGCPWAGRVWGWRNTHPEGWARRQRLPRASCAPHGLGLGRQQGSPTCLHRSSSWAHAVGPAAILSDNCYVPETHTHKHTHPHPRSHTHWHKHSWCMIPNTHPQKDTFLLHTPRDTHSGSQHRFRHSFIHLTSID